MGSVVEIRPLTRVEGHGSIAVVFEKGQVERVDLMLYESPRLFEALLKGKSFAEVPEIVCRICSLCSTVHKVTALEAVEKALGVRVSEVVRLTRELIACGGEMQSHALHLYCLVLPDLLGVSGIAEAAKAAPERVRSGLAIKAAGNLIQETVGGRLIHPVNLTVGGLGKRIGKDDLLRLKDALAAIVSECLVAVKLFAVPPPYPRLPRPRYLALARSASEETLVTVAGELCRVGDYRSEIVEEVLPHSRAKRALVGGEPATVSALSRLNLHRPETPLALMAFQEVQGEIVGKDLWANPAAQAVELVQGVERALDLIERLLELKEEGVLKATLPRRWGEGTAAFEAPRGTLIHSYAFDEEGLCTAADVITPTSLNQEALTRDLLALARLLEGAEEAVLCLALERLTRAYDPCISCAVHLVKS